MLGTCTRNAAVSNFSMTLMGCGIMALPKVFASTGIALGLLGMVVTYFLTVGSANVIVRMSHTSGIMSYAEMVRLHFGSAGAIILQLSIIVNNMVRGINWDATNSSTSSGCDGCVFHHDCRPAHRHCANL